VIVSRDEAGHDACVLEGMRIILITALCFVGVALASASPASALPPCLSGVGTNFGGASKAKEIYVRSCRAPSPGGKMREYGFIRIGPRATAATDCILKIRTGTRIDGHVGFPNSPITWGSCRSALRKGKDMIAYGSAIPLRSDHQPQFTEFCYELQKNGKRLSGHCVWSQLV
jgi:hypothetical protein